MKYPSLTLADVSDAGMTRLVGTFQVGGPTSCWEWKGTRNSQGYGVFVDRRRQFKAHRLVFELLRGRIPAGKVLDHICRNRACVNPDHLEPVMNGMNVLRGLSPHAVNDRKTHCKHGHEFTVENTFIDHRGRRGCRACRRIRDRAFKKKRYWEDRGGEQNRIRRARSEGEQ